MKTYILVLLLLIITKLCGLSQDTEDYVIRYPRISVSWNPIFFLQEYAIEEYSVNWNTTTGDVLYTDFDCEILYPTANNLTFYTGHEFKLGLIPASWTEFGLGYYFFDCSTYLFFKEEVSATYHFTDGTSETFSSNPDLYYFQRFRGLFGYLKFNIPVINHQKKGDERGYSLNICPQYGFSMNTNKKSSYSGDYSVTYPVYPDTYETYSPHSVPAPYDDITVREYEISGKVAKSYMNIFSIGIEFNYLKCLSLYIDYCYYSSLEKDLYLEHNFFEVGALTGTHVRIPATLIEMSTIKTGIAIQLPLRYN